jgi:hypothetical protein
MPHLNLIDSERPFDYDDTVAFQVVVLSVHDLMF